LPGIEPGASGSVARGGLDFSHTYPHKKITGKKKVYFNKSSLYNPSKKEKERVSLGLHRYEYRPTFYSLFINNEDIQLFCFYTWEVLFLCEICLGLGMHPIYNSALAMCALSCFE
jgi:hypothetical protein